MLMVNLMFSLAAISLKVVEVTCDNHDPVILIDLMVTTLCRFAQKKKKNFLTTGFFFKIVKCTRKEYDHGQELLLF